MSGILSGAVLVAEMPLNLRSSSCKLVFVKIADAAEINGVGRRALAIKWIAKDCVLSDRSVQRWIKELKSMGLITARRGGGRGNVPTYDVNVGGLLELIPQHLRPGELAKAAKEQSKKGDADDALFTERVTSRALKGDTRGTKGRHRRHPTTNTTKTTSADLRLASIVPVHDPVIAAAFEKILSTVKNGDLFLGSYSRHVKQAVVNVSEPGENRWTLFVDETWLHKFSERLEPYGFSIRAYYKKGH